MKPKKVTVESEAEERQKAFCDLVISRAADLMASEGGAPVPMILDRLLTYATAQAAVLDGSAKTATALRTVADKIEAGLFHSITGEGEKPN
ncbi:hypothetical protein G6L13_31170 [Agrobacterium tumefaciens]|uniref:hypothetical protein n=1 Tax=Agrobacterium tumefaciens TaxID=358 RepID=UPI0015737A8F|nr:hypothetical protein [Agrobacterium tumefaciens]NTA84908.1 hypothetical protein [Agrobacterium tumefaciens]